MRSLKKVLDEAKSLLKYWKENPPGKDTSEGDWLLLRGQLKRVLHLDKIQKDNLDNTFGILLKQKASYELFVQTILRVIANKEFLNEMEIPLWDGTPVDAFIAVLGTTSIKTKTNTMIELHCRVIGGLASGLKLSIKLSEPMCIYLLDHKLGLGKNNNLEAIEIGGLMFRCILEDVGGNYKASEFSTNDFIRQHNKKIIEKRADPFKCSFTSMDCFRCIETCKTCKLSPRWAE